MGAIITEEEYITIRGGCTASSTPPDNWREGGSRVVKKGRKFYETSRGRARGYLRLTGEHQEEHITIRGGCKASSTPPDCREEEALRYI